MWRKSSPLPAQASWGTPMTSTQVLSASPYTIVKVRNAANLKEVKARITSVKNISKITSTMKLVAASKLTKAQKNMEIGEPYKYNSQVLLEREFPLLPLNEEGKEAELDEETTQMIKNCPNHLIVVLTSDRGLCGAVNSSVVRTAKRLVELNPTRTRIVAFGEKAYQGLQMEYLDKIISSTIGISGNNATCAAEVFQFAERVWQLDWDKLTVVHNSFINVMAYRTSRRILPSKESFLDKNRFPEFELEEDREQLLSDYYAQCFADFILSSIVENQAIELSSRMITMDGATTNAVELGKRLTLKYNKVRQASITTELIEITSGAAVIQENENKD